MASDVSAECMKYIAESNIKMHSVIMRSSKYAVGKFFQQNGN